MENNPIAVLPYPSMILFVCSHMKEHVISSRSDFAYKFDQCAKCSLFFFTEFQLIYFLFSHYFVKSLAFLYLRNTDSCLTETELTR